MVSFPWSLLLTAAFTFTGLVCVVHLVRHRHRAESSVAGPGGLAPRMDSIVHANHLVMSIGMIFMTWVNIGTIALWIQSFFFAALAVVMVIGSLRAPSRTSTVSLFGHIALNSSMVWMLLAMPLLMGHKTSGGDHADGDHARSSGMGHSPDMSHGMAMAPIPDWAATVNWVAVGLSALAAIWWIGLLVRSRDVGVHMQCHAVMGFGMALMLFLM